MDGTAAQAVASFREVERALLKPRAGRVILRTRARRRSTQLATTA
jgi:hypothetical protein